MLEVALCLSVSIRLHKPRTFGNKDTAWSALKDQAAARELFRRLHPAMAEAHVELFQETTSSSAE